VPTIEENIMERLAEKFGTRPELSDSLVMIGVDSVGMAELTFEIEKVFQIKVDDALLDVETVQDLADYIRQKQQF
jgi:acyl carrier protein